MSAAAQRWRRALLLAAIAVGVLWGGWNAWAAWRHRKAIAEIEADLDDGRHATAARKLSALLARQPNADDALYLLGACEMARGQTKAADDAWARVPPGSPLAPRAIRGRMQLRAQRGRLAEAEQIVRDALDDPRIDSSRLPIELGPLFCQQGRLEEILRLIEARWEALDRSGEGASESAINLVRMYIELRRRPVPVEVIGSDLDPAARSNPQDDRIWLGKANLAIRVGAYDEAARWLDACLRRRPDDVPVWRARLDWAVATRRVAEAQEAMTHLPVGESAPAQVPRLAAWLARRRGDRGAERRALERLIAVDPTDTAAFGRLAELAVRDGQPARADELRRRKLEIDRLEARYQELSRRNQPTRDAAEMAHLAEQLGRRFEARAYLTVAIAADPDRDDLRRDRDRLNRLDRSRQEPGRTLADVLAAELDGADGSAPSPAARSSQAGIRPAPG
jgi:tetratricopeptide (TPR) repeat protein